MDPVFDGVAVVDERGPEGGDLFYGGGVVDYEFLVMASRYNFK